MRLKREQIQRAIKDEKWQEFRLFLKGRKDKKEKLEEYLQKNNTENAKIQVQNYVNALLRAGIKYDIKNLRSI